MKNKIYMALTILTFGCWIGAIVTTICCIVDPTSSIADSWFGWAIYMVAQIVRGIVGGDFKEYASIMKFLIRNANAR